MVLTRIQSVRVADKSAQYLLLNVSTESEDAPQIIVTATEGEQAYIVKCEVIRLSCMH